MTLPGGRRALVKVAAAIMAAGLLAGCTGGSAPAPPRPPGKGSYFHRAGAINLQNGSYPSFLAFGSRDTLWLTENGGNVIASVDASGSVRQYSILAGTNNDPQDNDIRLLWPVTGAQQFGGLAVAPDGSLWLADGVASTIRHFVPPATGP